MQFSGPAGTAFEANLPPADDRPATDSIACLGRWNLRLPGQHLLWDRYCLALTHLRDMPCLTPAKKAFDAATHEILVAAISPHFPEKNFLAGGIQILTPVNHAAQFTAKNDHQAYLAAQHMVRRLVDGLEFAEPEGIMGARSRFKESLRRYLITLD